jgi:Uma2 family endonuclease
MLGFQLLRQLNPDRFHVRIDQGHMRFADETYYILDTCVVPAEYSLPLRDHQDVLEVYDQRLPLVVEVWSPWTGEYDIDAKVPGYQKRGDLEIWRVHTYERTVIAWRLQPDGSYTEASFEGGIVEVVSVPGVAIDLDELFRWT